MVTMLQSKLFCERITLSHGSVPSVGKTLPVRAKNSARTFPYMHRRLRRRTALSADAVRPRGMADEGIRGLGS